ncbi:MAG: mannose-1-phosphate guanylyltransferase [Rhizobiales bacterium PAR1]|nr:MAG: mannose-1-phosphate guanylyltransferase [Rhizobiales bacterium PAR1]
MVANSYVVILCGGSGTRLWPASRPSRPKQFTHLVSSETLFLHTARRAVVNHDERKLLVVAGRAHEATILDQLEYADFEGSILIEPEARDSGPAIAAAAAYVATISPDAVMFVLASDHYIPETGAFQASLAVAEQAAREGLIATLGILPTHASTAYGYIAPASAPIENHYTPIREFREKPDRATAEQFVRDGYLWNSGNFVATAGTLLAAFETFEPELAAAARRAADEVVQDGLSYHLGPSFHEAKKISIDFAVMERARNTCVVPVGWQWSDLGAWDAVHAVVPPDQEGNVRTGETVAIDTCNSLIRAAPGMIVAAVGLRDLAVIADRDAVLVCQLDASQSVKQVVDELKRRNLPAVDLPAESRVPPLAVQAAELKSWLFNAALPLWWCAGADHERGGFHEMIDLDGEPVGDIRRCRVQSRQAYVYATAGALGWSGPWKSAVQHAFDALERTYLRADGLYRTLVDHQGQVLDETAKLYDQAFVLLALAASKSVIPGAEDKALALLARLESFRHEQGGFRENESEVFQSNPHMHLFEACLAWVEAGGDAQWAKLAADIAKLACTCFFVAESGAIHEFFDTDWKPASGVSGQRVEPGHQFEWAWLLERWSRLSGDANAAVVARRLFNAGQKGIDRQRKVAMNALATNVLDQAHGPLDAGARLWPQTEWLKAACLLSDGKGASAVASPRDILASLTGVRRYLDTPVKGLWRDKMLPDGALVEEPAPASTLYHILGAILAVQSAE